MEDLEKPINLSLNTVQFSEGWAEILVDQFHQALDFYNIGQLDGALWQSIMAQIIQSGGEVQKIITKFLQYGRFLDMGVGRGVPIGGAGTKQFSAARNDDGTLKHYARKPKHWYSKTYYHQVMRFAELYAKQFNKQVPVQITEAMNADIKLNL